MDGRMTQRINVRVLCGAGLAFALCLVGCETRLGSKPAAGTSRSTVGTPGAAESERLTAEQILDRMLAAYRSAKSYRDEATITLSYRQGGRLFTDDAPIAVKFSRPARLHVRAYQVTLASDGKQLRGVIEDPSTRNIDGQFLVRPAPGRLQLSTLLDDPLLADQLGNALVAPDAGRIPLQLAFLLAQEPITLLADQETQLTRLDPGTADGHACVRIEAKTAKGNFRFWIDRENFLLRRLEYPRDALVPRIAKDTEVRDLQLIANFKQATFDDAFAPADFELPIPEGVKQVRFFVPPPQPLPSDKFGTVLETLSLSTPEGGKVTRASLSGRIAVLLWFSNHAECEPSLRQLAEVHKQYADDQRLAFYAVSTEPSAVSHQKLRELLKSWEVDTPLARDLAAQGRDLLEIHDTPTLVVLNGDGALQLYEVGVNPQMSEQLPQVLVKLLAGEDVAATIVRQQELEQQQYARRLEVASGSEPLSVVEIPNTPLREAAAPQKLQLTERWTIDSLKQPGNLALAPPTVEAGSSTVLALDAGRRLVELKLADGLTARTVELDLPPDVSVQRFRVITDKQGQRFFAAWLGLGKHVYILSADGKRLATYPPEDARHDGVRDVLFADLNGDGTPELYVAFLGAAGVHAVSVAGERLWSSRALGSTLSLAVSSPNPLGWRKLIVVGAQGQLVRFNQFGNSDPPHTLSGWSLAQLDGDSSGAGERTAPLCGLGIDREGRFGAVALNEQFIEQWSYPLPEGVWRSAVEPLRSAPLLGPDRPAWLAAAVDGGLHVVSDDGDFSDFWHLGYLPEGIAAGRDAAGNAVLVISSPTEVRAWNVAQRDSTP